MTNPFSPFLTRAGIVLLDGALATELERRGADLKDPLWSAKVLMDNPELIRQVHQDYFRAGADVATTASYQATFAGFAARGLDVRQAGELMVRSVRLAQEARNQAWEDSANPSGRLRPLVAASAGCYGASLADGSEFRGDYGLSLQELVNFHRPRLEVLVETGADLIAFETVPCQIEGEAILRLLEEFPRVPAWLSFSCGDVVNVCHGEPFAECVGMTKGNNQVVAVGLNCTAPRFVAELLRGASSKTDKILLAYPNRGERWDPAGRCWKEGSAEDVVAGALDWFQAGACVLGGCCRTTPEDIRLMGNRIRSFGPIRKSQTP